MDLRLTKQEFIDALQRKGITVTEWNNDYVFVPTSFLDNDFEPSPNNDTFNINRLYNMSFFDNYAERYISVSESVKANERIKAIKAIRGLTGWGLKDAKEFTDRVFQWDGVSRTFLKKI